MIKIEKGNPPDQLAQTNARVTTQNNLMFENHSAEYLSGNRHFSFTEAYRSDAIKTALKECQYNKCCFSEAKFVGDDSHVEHFRPKGRVDSWPKGESYYPGYYWLAYDWSNLLICKSTINSSYKRNFFPLENETIRNRTHNDTNVERPLLIDPSIDNPREHIIFKGDEPVALSDRGRYSIEILRLRNPEFEEARRSRLAILKLLKGYVDSALAAGWDRNHVAIANSIALLKSYLLPSSEFSSMVIDFLSDWPHIQ